MLLLLDVELHPIQLNCQSRGDDLCIYFHPLARLSRKQRKYQPTLFMTRDTWNYVKDPSVTHAGAFGSDYDYWSQAIFEKHFFDSTVDLPSKSWVVVWKFPGDLNYLRNNKNQILFNKIHDIPLPVGEYALWDDGWVARNFDHPLMRKGSPVEKMRVDVSSGSGVHYLEARDDMKVAMIGSHYFIDEFWKVTPSEKENVIALLNALYDDCGIYAFPCYGQHHAIVFYIDKKDKSLITPQRMARHLQRDIVRQTIADYSYLDIDSWVDNFIRLSEKATMQSPAQTKKATMSTPEKTTARHEQPDPTGTLLRSEPKSKSVFASKTPVPNGVTVHVVDTSGEFSLVTYRNLHGWLRTKYLS